VPAIATRPVADPAALDAALRELAVARYDWLVFTSANAVESVASRCRALGVAPPPAVRIASVGPATTGAIQEAWPAAAVAIQPVEDFRGAGLVEAFARAGGSTDAALAGSRILLPVSDRARDTVETGLTALGAHVDRVVAYETAPVSSGEGLREALQRRLDAIVFASPSAVEAFHEAAGGTAERVPVVAMGPTTAEAAHAAGMSVHAVAQPSTTEGVAEALLRMLSGRRAVAADEPR
jgi:uroporphyrinogen-III synthase